MDETLTTKGSDGHSGRTGFSKASLPGKTPKLNSLQAYRGIAALLVLFFHASNLSQEKYNYAFLGNIFSFGYSGVDFFFVLSGFIILQMHYQDLNQPSRWRTYAIKRFIRLFPIFWLVMLFIIPVYFFNPHFGAGYERNVSVIVKSLLLIPQHHFPVLNVSWTLCHEVWFYLLFLFAIFAPRHLTRLSVAIITMASFVLWVLTLTIAKEKSPLTYSYGFALSSHNLEFALGCLGSYLLRHHRPRHPKFYLIAGFVWFATAAVFDASLFKYFGNTHRILSYGFPAFLIVVGSVTQELEGRLTVPRLLTYLGDASYSIYLIHYPLLSLTAKLVLKFHIVSLLGPFTSVILMIVLVTAAGCCCYSFIEKPMLETLRKKFLPQPLLNPA